MMHALVLSIFVLLNGPLWLITETHVFTHGPSAPDWLIATVKTASRLIGTVGIIYWLFVISQGDLRLTILFGIGFAGATFVLLNGRPWLVKRINIFGRNSDAPQRREAFFRWFCRVMSAAGIVTVPFISLRLLFGSWRGLSRRTLAV